MKQGVRVNRREFIRTGAAAGLLAAGAAPALAAGTTTAAGPAVIPARVKPIVIASANGNKFKNGGRRTCVAEAFKRITAGEDVLDAVIAGVNIVEQDPLDNTVGYGGLPNADGVVQLDACCMHGPKRQAGAVACIEGVRTPSLVAKAVMEQTDHHLLVGKGAQEFARHLGFKIEDDLNTEGSRALWLEWKRQIDPLHYLDPAKRMAAMERARRGMLAAGRIDPRHYHGTINCDGINATGEICGVTTTSGLAFKIPGRVGDSAILGAGLYVDTEAGAAGSTGRGEANLYNLSCHRIVDDLRRGMHPKDAGMEMLRRIRANTVEKRLLNSQGNPNFYVNFYILARNGDYAGVSMYSSFLGLPIEYAVCDQNGPRLMPVDSLLGEPPKDLP